MKYIQEYDSFISEKAITRIATDEVIPGTNKASATEEPVEPANEAQDENKDKAENA